MSGPTKVIIQHHRMIQATPGHARPHRATTGHTRSCQVIPVDSSRGKTGVAFPILEQQKQEPCLLRKKWTLPMVHKENFQLA